MDAVQNSLEQQREQLLEDIKTLPAEVLQEVADFVSRLHSEEMQPVEDSNDEVPYSPYKELEEFGLIGCGEGPADLSTNYKAYLAEGFAEKDDNC